MRRNLACRIGLPLLSLSLYLVPISGCVRKAGVVIPEVEPASGDEVEPPEPAYVGQPEPDALQPSRSLPRGANR